jgi:hypothetical protein
MFQLFLRARLHNFIQSRLAGDEFKARSPARDLETDHTRVGVILDAVENALRSAELEQSGLDQRVTDVLARAAVTMGNGSDEYLDRDERDSHHQDLFNADIANGQRRLRELSSSVSHFKFLKAAILSRFPDFKPAAISSE